MSGRQRRVLLAPVPESARKAREFTAAAVRHWGMDPLTDDAVMVASELVANAIAHGVPVTAGAPPPAVTLSWRHCGHELACVVTDPSSKPPVMAVPCAEAESGHGLHIVHALTVAWGWAMLSAREKVVWAVLAAGEGGPAPGAWRT